MNCTGYAWENLICGKCLIWLLELRNFTTVGFYELLNLLSYPWRGALKTLPGVRAEILFYVIQMGCCRIITIDLCAHLQWFLYPTKTNTPDKYITTPNALCTTSFMPKNNFNNNFTIILSCYPTRDLQGEGMTIQTLYKQIKSQPF